MRKIIAFFGILFLVLGCSDGTIEKPKNLIERNKMVDILYDVSLLEAIKTQSINGGITNKTENEYIYKKYNIDSIRFVESNRYYASDLEEYKKMFEEVRNRLSKETKSVEEALKKSGDQIPKNTNTTLNPSTPQVQ